MHRIDASPPPATSDAAAAASVAIPGLDAATGCAGAAPPSSDGVDGLLNRLHDDRALLAGDVSGAPAAGDGAPSDGEDGGERVDSSDGGGGGGAMLGGVGLLNKLAADDDEGERVDTSDGGGGGDEVADSGAG